MDEDDLASQPTPSGRRVGAVLCIVSAVVVVWAIVWSVTRHAEAHEALPTAAQPQGWKYPFSCCSGYDCRPVASVKELPQGYSVPSGEVVGYQDTRIRNSPDGLWHWCSVAGAPDGRTICLFVPPRAY